MPDIARHLILKRKPWQLIIAFSSTLLAIYIPLNIVLNLSAEISLTFLYWLITAIFFADILINYISPPQDVSTQYDVK
ncbi:MAG: hypothetical protein O6940_04055 [Ignavibacteria bacterium]|nr:hypothetical protein [Ignavibacteria bacterium]